MINPARSYGCDCGHAFPSAAGAPAPCHRAAHLRSNPWSANGTRALAQVAGFFLAGVAGVMSLLELFREPEPPPNPSCGMGGIVFLLLALVVFPVAGTMGALLGLDVTRKQR